MIQRRYSWVDNKLYGRVITVGGWLSKRSEYMGCLIFHELTNTYIWNPSFFQNISEDTLLEVVNRIKYLKNTNNK